MSRPVVTLLSGSPAASRRTQALLYSMFSMKPVAMEGREIAPNDNLNCSLPMTFKSRLCFDSTASVCMRSGAVIHIISLAQPSPAYAGFSASTEPARILELISITDCESGDDPNEIDYIQAIRKARTLLSEQLNKSFFSRLKFALKQTMGLDITASDFLGADHRPYLNLPPGNGASSRLHENPFKIPMKTSEKLMHGTSGAIRLREVVLPYSEEADSEACCSSLLSQLSSSCLCRPVDGQSKKTIAGLYQWHSDKSTIAPVIRPLPAAKADFALSNPSLIFQCPSLEKAFLAIRSHGAIPAKVGFHGGKKGQLMVIHKDFTGLDIRFCESDNLSSSFNESQQALLAGSLEGLQNPNVVLEGESASKDTTARAGTGGDCWVEFRENMKRPKGFLKNNFIK